MKPDKNDPVFLAWCAGFFDGEGSVGVYPNWGGATYKYKGEVRPRKSRKVRFILRVTIYQNHVRPLRMIREVFGGTLFYQKTTRVWFLAMGGNRAADLIAAIEPYSVVKKEEINTALEFAAIRHRPGPSGATAQPERQAELAMRLVVLKKKDPSEAAL